ncbi:LytR C-terminal domain-containing protein [Nocardia lijiangensis]|uniref:LytR C-terminal domain-containing protein n=1 Tax=Nocardia lijiangensis TaxID=299618 RepID=UPI00082A6C36|nr:LytR C-terminal domain-containing protein [Nocardia lijiangensis]
MSQTNPTSGGPPLRALAMVLIALAIVFAGLGAMSLSSSDSDATNAEESSATAAQQVTSAAPATTAAPATVATTTVATTAAPTTTTAAQTTTGAPAAGVDRAVPVRVLNNSLVAGLAARTADQLTANGWTNVAPGNYAGGNIAKTTVYYGNTAGEREAAMAIAREIGATAEPKSAVIGDNGPGVVVILTGN